jgi:hypothetical protein
LSAGSSSGGFQSGTPGGYTRAGRLDGGLRARTRVHAEANDAHGTAGHVARGRKGRVRKRGRALECFEDTEN